MVSKLHAKLKKEIEKCDDILEKDEDYTPEEIDDFQSRIIDLYEDIIPNLTKNLNDDIGRYDEKYDNLISNIRKLRERIDIFICKNEDDNLIAQKDNQRDTIVVSQSVNNTITIEANFNNAREDIGNMSSLTESQINEIMSRIDELEKIVQSKDAKTKKWDNAKEIVKWIADRGVDVALTLLPLLLNIK